MLNLSNYLELLIKFIGMKFKILCVTVFTLMSCKNKSEKVEIATVTVEPVTFNTVAIDTTALEVYDFSGFKKFLNRRDDKIYVINFWATWCAPCVKELPYFEKLNAEYASKNVEVILVSLDFPHLYESKLKPFIINKNLKSKVIALDDVDMDNWIPKVSESWSGSIPATIMYRNNNKKFFEQSFSYSELEEEVKQFLN